MENKVKEFLNEVFGEVRAFEENGQIWFCANDVLKALEYSEGNWRTTISRKCKKDGVKKCNVTDKLGRKVDMNFINEYNAYIIISNCNTVSNYKKEEFIKWIKSLGFFNEVYLNSRKEIDFILKLEESLKPFNIAGIRQYPILNYRIDYYIPSLNVAIEYDENEHKQYTYEEHEGRQKEIEKELGCKFIRVTDKESNYDNVKLVFNEIVKYCLNKNLYILEINNYMNYLLDKCKELENEINDIRNLQNKLQKVKTTYIRD